MEQTAIQSWKITEGIALPAVTTFLFFGALFWELLLERGNTSLLRVTQLILLIAGVSYAFITLYPQYEQFFRYLDWFVTTPLLLYAFVLATGQGENLFPLLVADFVMLFTGFLARYVYRSGSMHNLLLIVSFAALAYIVFETGRIATSLNSNIRFLYLFFLLWILYGFVFFLDNRNPVYTGLDIVAKIGFSFGLWTLITE
jgi:bacteriorhodopsin